MATEDDPVEVTTCHHFIDEIEKRLDDITIGGNYFRADGPLTDPATLVQEYRDHKPYGTPKPL